LLALYSGEIPEEPLMPGVRDAAVALIAEAPETTVLAVLKMLVAAFEPAPARAPEPPSPPPRRVLAPRRKPATTAAAAAATPVDPAWDELRGQVKAAMAERGVSWSDLAAAITRSEVATRIAISSRRPPPPIVRTRLQAWIEAAPAVAAPPVPFPGSGTGHRGNGHEHPGGAYSSSAA
jgi:hypothetical protein